MDNQFDIFGNTGCNKASQGKLFETRKSQMKRKHRIMVAAHNEGIDITKSRPKKEKHSDKTISLY